jgi:tRNA pseudouridine38-40 synthase
MPRKEGPRKPSAGIAAYRLVLEYEGTRFQGWQKQGPGQTQAGVRTVAGTLERLLAQNGHPPRALVGSGRTDAGVHALAQVAHLHLEAPGPRPEELQLLLDRALPVDVALVQIQRCPAGFHARHDALNRTYLYRISRRRSGLSKPFLWWVKGDLNEGWLTKAWEVFQGFHNISAFADLDPDDDPRCEIQRCEWTAVGSMLLLRVTASHFKTRQVRRMVGASVLCGLGQAKVAEILRDLEDPTPEAALRWSERAAPAAGLFLERVRYPGELTQTPIDPSFCYHFI